MALSRAAAMVSLGSILACADRGGPKSDTPHLPVDLSASDRRSDLAIPDTRHSDYPDLSSDHSSLDPSWIFFVGGKGDAEGYRVAQDATGNSYVVGAAIGTVKAAAKTLQGGNGSTLALKLDSTGKVIWAEVYGTGSVGGNASGALATAVDGTGGSYVAGIFLGTVTFGSTVLTSQGLQDGYLMRLGPTGAVDWTVAFGGASANDSASAVIEDGAGQGIVAGSFQATATFGSTQLTSSGATDIYVAKVGTGGSVLWAVAGGGQGLDSATDLALGPAGSICLVGETRSSVVKFGSISASATGSPSALVVKLDSLGNWTWASIANGAFVRAQGVAADTSGNVYVTGRFTQQATFGSTTLTGSGPKAYDVFVSKLDSSGLFAWAVAGGPAVGEDLVVEHTGSISVAGWIGKQATFGAIQLAGYGGVDAFVARVSSGGTWLNAIAAGGKLRDQSLGIAADSAGNLYTTGRALLNAVPCVAPAADTLSFGKKTHFVDGCEHLFVWMIPNGAL